MCEVITGFYDDNVQYFMAEDYEPMGIQWYTTNAKRVGMCIWMAMAISSIGYTWISLQCQWSLLSAEQQAVFLAQFFSSWLILVSFGLLVPVMELWR